MNFQPWPALLAGAVAGAAMEIARWLPAATGRPLTLDFLHTWGSLLAAGSGRLRALGLILHLLLSAAIGLLYCLAFDLLGAREDLWVWGLAAGAVHLALAGFVVAAIPLARADRPGERLRAGLFAGRLGDRDTAAFVLTHLLFGFTLAVVYALAHPGGGAQAAF